MPNEADTCRRYVVPRLQAAGWEEEPHRINEQVTFTDGRIVVTGRRGRRKEGKRADYVLRYRPDFPIAVVEAKPTYKMPGEGMQQAKDYAEILDLKFAYSTNGHGIIEFDYTTGLEREIEEFPTPDELWARLAAKEGITDAGMVPLKPLTKLTHLRLNDCQVSGAGLAHLEGLTGLTTLELNGTAVSDTGLVHVRPLVNLELLYLSNTSVTDAGLGYLRRLKKLRALMIEDAHVTDEGIGWLKQALPEASFYH